MNKLEKRIQELEERVRRLESEPTVREVPIPYPIYPTDPTNTNPFVLPRALTRKCPSG